MGNNKACKPPVRSGYKKRKFVDGKWVCTICQVSYCSYFKLNAHLDTVHNVKVAKFTCNACEYTGYSKKKFQLHKKCKRHLKRSAVSKGQDGQEEQDLVIYSCDRCQVTFLSLNQYNSHLKSKKHKTQQKEEEDRFGPTNNNNIDLVEENVGSEDAKDPLLLGSCNDKVMRLNIL